MPDRKPVAGAGANAAGALPTAVPPAMSASSRRAMFAILMAVGLSILDTALANVALPVIAADLHTSPAASVWIVNAYQLAMVATLMPFAALGAIVGHRRVYLLGLATFVLASLACALSDSLATLTAARVLQGLGGSAVMSVNTALIRIIYPPNRLGRGMGINTLIVGVAYAVGPTVASLILSVASWPWLFAINVPLGGLALLVAWPALPDSIRTGHRFDPLAAGLNVVTFAALIYALGEATQRGPAAWTVATALVALLAGWLLVRREAGHPAPMLPVDLFRNRSFALAATVSSSAYAAQGLAFVSLPFYLETVQHLSQVQTGFILTPWPVFVALAAPIAGRLSDRYQPGMLSGLGLAALALGLASSALLPANPGAFDIGIRMALCGAGFGFFQSPNLKSMISSAPPERSGGASAIIATSRLIGQATGAALVALCFGLFSHHGSTVALTLGAIFAALASLLSWLRLAVRVRAAG
ncbi:major facilitator superfamily MFS-1 transporter [Burkholderia plantarii]|uniref:Major facilitator superfamily MFS-1 transporter n=2 Tax=Burkholderia plantarii TaxID=41899 RepID=A0A0B6RZH6_BURPL|nr:major facilitator superfamily MFS-1 transporter [Burkholderia plantarii]